MKNDTVSTTLRKRWSLRSRSKSMTFASCIRCKKPFNNRKRKAVQCTYCKQDVCMQCGTQNYEQATYYWFCKPCLTFRNSHEFAERQQIERAYSNLTANMCGNSARRATVSCFSSSYVMPPAITTSKEMRASDFDSEESSVSFVVFEVPSISYSSEE